jgi:hypothetical protein
MRRQPLAAAVSVMVLVACSRDVTLPPLPGPGSLQGRVVYAVAGQSAPAPAAGARVTLLGSSLGAMTGSDGRFLIGGLTQTRGALLFQVDFDHDGVADRQTSLRLEDVHAGPGVDLSLGDVVVVENARIRGRVTKGNVPTPTTGHGGITVFVPEGPFLTLTGDDGSYVLNDLPEGRLSLTFFRDGYSPQLIDGVTLRAGEDFTAREVTLTPLPPGATPPPGSLGGTITFSPALVDGSAATVSAYSAVGAALTAHPSPAGAFSFAAVEPGLYRVEAALTGYATAVIPNVMIGSGQQVQLAVALARDGITVVPPPPPVGGSCVAGSACTLPAPCQVGQVTCVGGAPFCGTIGNALDGIPCAANQICSAGACVQVCTAGAACRPPADPCRSGTVACPGGLATCVAGTQPLADGAACGADQVCLAGACTGCLADRSCTPTNPCDSGLTSCASGVQACRDTGLPVADGTACGAGLTCAGGTCAACTPGKACTPAGFACHSGATSCATGREVCADTGLLVADGVSCGSNQVCRSGGCAACTANAACTPANRCHAGAVACSTGAAVCVDQLVALVAGTSCGTGQVCDGGGGCVACAAGSACTPINPCHTGAIGCASGAPICGDTGVALANGSGCGPGQVCGGGTCAPCAAGTACTPPGSRCHFGAITCGSGAPVCGDSGVQVADGASCGIDQVCLAGACGACVVGGACDGAAGHATAPVGPNPCLNYATSCSSGAPTCIAGGNRPDGIGCGGTNVCRAGACGAPGYTLRLASLGAGAPSTTPGFGPPGGTIAVTLQVVTVTGVPVLTPQTVTVTAPTGGGVSPAAAASSAVDGTLTFTLRLSRPLGPQHFSASTPAAFAPLDVAVTAERPPDGTVLPLVNATNRQICGICASGVPGPAWNAVLQGASAYLGSGLAVRQGTGDIFIFDSNSASVKRLASDGVLSVAAGTEYASGYAGDGMLATTALITSGTGLAIDERIPASPILYLADSGNQRLRQVDLATGSIDLVAGDGTTGTAAPWGDGPDARLAQFSDPAWPAVGPDGSVYIADRNHGRIRRIAPPGAGPRAITTVAAAGTCGSTLTLSSLAVSQDAGASLAVDEGGRLFASARFCGGPFGATVKPAVARLDAGGWTLVAGGGTVYASATGAHALDVGFAWSNASTLHVPIIAFDRPAGGRANLFLAVITDNLVARVDAVTGRWDVVTHGGTTLSGDFGPASAASLPGPSALAFVGRDLLLPHSQWGGLRVIAGAGAASSGTATCSAVSGSGGAPWPDQPPFACAVPGTCAQPENSPLVARLVDGLGVPIAGQRGIRFGFATTAVAGGSFAGSSNPTTDSAGLATVGVRPGLATGSYGVVAHCTDLHGDDFTGSPLSFAVTAVAPPSGTVFTAVNDSHVSGRAGLGGPGSLAQVSATHGSALLGDGTLAFATDDTIYRLDANGLLSVLAGTGARGYAGDGGPAVAAAVNGPRGLASDAASNLLYFADNLNGRVRAIDLSTGFINLVAGTGGTVTGGDGGPALAATILGPKRISVVSGGLYVEETSWNNTWGNGRLRRIGIDRAAADYGVITAWLTPGFAAPGVPTTAASCAVATSPIFTGCWGGSNLTNCSAAADPTGVLYVSGTFCGPGYTTTGSVMGVVRVNPATGALEPISGSVTGTSMSEGQALAAARFNGPPPHLVFDATGNLWLTSFYGPAADNVIGWVRPDAVTGHIEKTGTLHLVGQTASPQAPAAGAYQAAATAYFPGPYSITFTPAGHIFVTDNEYPGTYPINGVRIVW